MMREREIKIAMISIGSPFLKGYIQSFPNKQRIPLDKQDQCNTTSITLAPRKTPLHPAAHSPLHSTTVVNSTEPYFTLPNYKPYAIWKPNIQLQITNPMQFATKSLTIQ